MKYLVVAIAFAFLARPAFPLVEYAIRYDYISQVLCINKDKPALKCNGKCHLMKELAKAADTEKPASPDKKQSPAEPIAVFFAPAAGLPLFPVVDAPMPVFHYEAFFPKGRLAELLRPPIA